MEFIFVLAVVLIEVFFIHLFQVVEVIGAFGINALMDDKVFPVFFGNKGISTVRAAQLHGREAAFRRRKSGSTDLTEELAFGAVIPVKKRFRGVTAWAGAVVRDVTFRAATDGADFLTITFFVVRDKFFVSPVLAEVGNQREFINLEFLVFGGMGIIKSPLLERNISADKADQPAVLLVKVLNNRK